jgi:hypothetical protein
MTRGFWVRRSGRGRRAGGRGLDLVDHVHAADDLAEHRVAEQLGCIEQVGARHVFIDTALVFERGTGSPGGMRVGSRKALSFTLMKNCALAEFGSLVRAMARVPTTLRGPPLASASRPSWRPADGSSFRRTGVKAAALDHEVVDHAVEDGAVVVLVASRTAGSSRPSWAPCRGRPPARCRRPWWLNFTLGASWAQRTRT